MTTLNGKWNRYFRLRVKQIDRINRKIERARSFYQHCVWLSNLSEIENRLHIWNIETDYRESVFRKDELYQKLKGVKKKLFETYLRIAGKYKGDGRGDYANRPVYSRQVDFQLEIADEFIQGLMDKIENRQMREEEYTTFFNTPRCDIYCNSIKMAKARLEEAISLDLPPENWFAEIYYNSPIHKIARAGWYASNKLAKEHNYTRRSHPWNYIP